MRALGARAGAAAERTGGAGRGRRAEERREERSPQEFLGAWESWDGHLHHAAGSASRGKVRSPEELLPCSPGFASLLSAAWAALSGEARMGLPRFVELVCFGVGKRGWVQNLCLREKGRRQQRWHWWWGGECPHGVWAAAPTLHRVTPAKSYTRTKGDVANKRGQQGLVPGSDPGFALVLYVLTKYAIIKAQAISLWQVWTLLQTYSCNFILCILLQCKTSTVQCAYTGYPCCPNLLFCVKIRMICSVYPYWAGYNCPN